MTYSRQTFVQRMRSFTLVELVVAMGVIVVVASLTLVAVRQVARNTRQSSGVNAVMAALDNGRALAMKENKIVVVVFRPRLEGTNEMYVEAVLAEWSGQTAFIPGFFGGSDAIVDRFVPVRDFVPRRLPRGIKVASPLYGTGSDEDLTPAAALPVWTTQPNLPTIHQETGAGEPAGGLIGVMFGPDGATLSRNSQTDSHFMFIDFNADFLQQLGTAEFDYSGTFPAPPAGDLFEQFFANDEPMVEIAPFLAVFDDEEARQLRTGDWTSLVTYTRDLVGPDVGGNIAYITTRADRIHFNRYTGVAMK